MKHSGWLEMKQGSVNQMRNGVEIFQAASVSSSHKHTPIHTHYCVHAHAHTHTAVTSYLNCEILNFAAVMCPPLPDPENATIFVTGQAVGSQATYICSSGFVVRPGDVIIRNCLPTGEWSGSEPQCIRRSPRGVTMQLQLFNIHSCNSEFAKGGGRVC